MRWCGLLLLVGCHRVADDSDPVDSGETDETDTEDTSGPDRPPCASGSTFVSWTRDGGTTVAPVTTGPSTNTYTWSIAIAADAPDTLIAEHGQTLWRSTDAGCTFASLGTVSHSGWDLHAVGGGVVWGHVENGDAVVRWDGEIEETAGPGAGIVGMAIAGNTVRVGTTEAKLYDRAERGWTFVGGPSGVSSAYDWAFDPADLDRAVVGALREGVWWTHDGGATWTQATGITTPTNVFTVAWSAADAGVVWAEGLDIAQLDAGHASGGRHVWRSTDGGRSFTAVVDQTRQVTLTNGLPMTPDPVDANVVWFEFGTSFQGEGTWVYRYDHATGDVTRAHQPSWDEFRALVFSPGDPTLMYVALVDERIE